MVYQVTREDGVDVTVTNPSEYPDGKIGSVREPMVRVAILAPKDYVGTIMELCQSRRGSLMGMEYLGERVELRYAMPLGEIVFDFFDHLKSRTQGYASLDYEPMGEQEADLVKVDILLQGDKVDAFSAIAVSYTHLDVYKRQLIELTLGLRVERSTPLERCPLSLPKIIRNSFNTKDTTQVANIKSQIKRIKTNQKATERNRAYKSELRTVVPVSYTHLDVYKRQAWNVTSAVTLPRGSKCWWQASTSSSCGYSNTQTSRSRLSFGSGSSVDRPSRFTMKSSRGRTRSEQWWLAR